RWTSPPPIPQLAIGRFARRHKRSNGADRLGGGEEPGLASGQNIGFGGFFTRLPETLTDTI
ncbi:hypothetical protein, partial [Mesorhizobium sp. M1D.F.Ca.ET.234.01.1.1]|uniref:hypothetical protein n=1 Tax=Mesorhizobium sp. M1D.F.Ca.ET.234.01.1.1 TaxID=2563932 RepID=UPI001AEEDB54